MSPATLPPSVPSRRPLGALLRASWQHWLTMEGPRPGPWWLPWIWTAAFTVVVAFAFTVAGFAVARAPWARWTDLDAWRTWMGANLVVTGTIAVLIHLMFSLANPLLRDGRIASWKPWQVSLYHAAIPALGVVCGWPLGVVLAGDAVARHFTWATTPAAMGGMLAVSVVFALALHQWFSAKARQVIAEREAAEAQLRLLQGQIEPHFLFNTLANVASLIETDPPRARQMLDAFTDCLRGSLDGLRTGRRTLGDELALVRAYLQVQAMRLEDRLGVEIDVPADLLQVSLPTLVLQPLVENAVQHGIEPSLDGGTVRVTARRDGDALVLAVEDDGVGLSPGTTTDVPASARPARGGHALPNLRARLERLGGADTGLWVQPREPRGTRATLRLPATGTPA